MSTSTYITTQECSECNGTGMVQIKSAYDEDFVEVEYCPVCEGRGFNLIPNDN